MLILVTGGSGSGKSAFAESVVMGLKTRPNLYIATMYPFDEECHRRIARHRLMRRDKGFETLECYTGLKDAKIPSSGTTLLECMSNLVANEMFGGEAEDSASRMSETEREDFLVEKVTGGIRTLAEKLDKLVIVSNNVFEDGIPYDAQTMSYIRVLGRVNQELARMADHVTEVIVGIPVKVK